MFDRISGRMQQENIEIHKTTKVNLQSRIVNIKLLFFFKIIMVITADKIDDNVVDMTTQYLPVVFIKIKFETILKSREKILIFKGVDVFFLA